MSNYPPTPSFGGSFSLPSQLPPPPTSVMPHNNYQGPNGLKNTSHVPPDIRSALAVNSYSFNGNTQVMPPQAFGSGLPPPPFLNLAHFPHGSLPPPPFPPVPIPQHGFPAQFPILGQNGDTNASIAKQAQQVNRSAVNAQGSTLHSSQRGHIVGAEGEREEGELSDRDIKATSTRLTSTRHSSLSRDGDSQLPPIPPINDHQDGHYPSLVVRTEGNIFDLFFIF